MSHKHYHWTESDLFEEVGDSQCCRTESGKITHVIPYTHPLKPLFLSFIPCSVTFSLWWEEKNHIISERHRHECYLCHCK